MRPFLCLLLGWLVAIDGVAAAPAVRVEAVTGYDSNATRSEGQDAAGHPVSRVVVDLSDRGRPTSGWIVDAGYQGGVRTFIGEGTIPCREGRSDPGGEDALFHRLDAGLRGRIVGDLTLGARLDLRDRTTRDPCHPRDFTHLRGTAPVAWSANDFSAEIAGLAERFHYKANARYDSTTLGGRLRLGWSPGRWSLNGSAALLGRTYRGTTTDDGGTDEAFRLGFGVRYGGPVLLSAHYGFTANDTERAQGRGYDRHALTLGGTASLPWSFFLSGRVSVIRILHSEALLLPDDQTLRDEGRSAISLRLERPIDGRWSVVAHGGWWGSPFETGPEYDRWLALAGISYGATP